MQDSLDGRVALVSGGSRGIGLAIAEALGRRGATVVIVDLLDGADALEQLRAAVPGARFDARRLDVRDRAQVRAVVDDVVAQHGSLDVLVSNAGTVSRLDLEHMDDASWQRDVETNLFGTFLLTQAAVYPHMRDRGWGRIVTISSIAGIMGGPPTVEGGGGRSGPAYAASKGGVIAFTKWVAREVGHLGITANSVAPGPIATAMTGGVAYDLGGQVLQRMGEPADIGEAVAYLASPAAGFVTGQTLPVCGGSVIA